MTTTDPTFCDCDPDLETAQLHRLTGFWWCLHCGKRRQMSDADIAAAVDRASGAASRAIEKLVGGEISAEARASLGEIKDKLTGVTKISGVAEMKISIPPRVLKTLLPLGDVNREPGGRTFTGHPDVAFKPRGLMIWNAPDDAQVMHILIGPNYQLVASVGPIPAKWFAIAQSYEQVWQMQQQGLEPPGWGDFNVISVGMLVRVRIVSHEVVKVAGKLSHAVDSPIIAAFRSHDAQVAEAALDRIQVAMWGESIADVR